MGVESIERGADKLFPEFRRRLEIAQIRAAERLQDELKIQDEFRYAETLRTQARQTWLYAQGRTRPGKKVTWIRSPRYHGIGLAADHILRNRGYQCPHRVWEILREETRRQGLANPAWSAGDYGHVQWDPNDKPTLSAAAAWVRAGFPQNGGIAHTGKPKPGYDVRVFVNGVLLPDQEGFLEDGRTWVMVRPLADDLRYVIAEVQSDKCLLVQGDWEAPVPAEELADAQEPDKPQVGIDKFERWVPMQLRLIEGVNRGFVPLKDLQAFARTLTWDQASRTAKIWD